MTIDWPTIIALGLWLRAMGVGLQIYRAWIRRGLTDWLVSGFVLDGLGNALLAVVAWRWGYLWSALATALPAAFVWWLAAWKMRGPARAFFRRGRVI